MNVIRESAAARVAFCAADREHFVTEIAADDWRFSSGRAVVRQCQIAGAGAHVENRQRAGGRHESHGSPAPVVIDAERKQMIQKIISPGNLAKHAANAIR